MAGIPQIPGVGTKSYTPSARPVEGQQAVFDLLDLAQLPKTASVSGGRTETGADLRRGGSLPEAEAQALRDPSVSGRQVSRLLDAGTLAAIAESGDTALESDIRELAARLFMQAGELPKEISAQNRAATLFQGSLFETLRALLGQGADDTAKALAAGVLKTAAQLRLNGEALFSVSANLRRLAGMLSVNEALSGRILELASAWEGKPSGEAFSSLRDQTVHVLDEAGRSLLTTDAAKSLASLVTYSLSRVGGSYALLREHLAALLAHIADPAQRQALADGFARYAVRQGYEPPQTAPPREMPATAALAAQLEQAAASELYAERLAGMGGAVARLVEAMERGAISPGRMLDAAVELLADGAKGLPLLAAVRKELAGTETLQDVVDQLNLLLRSLPEGELRSSLFEGFSRAVELMHERGTLHDGERPPELLALADFLSKHQGNPVLRGLEGFDFASLLQNMLRAPGASTPLAHYLLPAEEGGERAVAELWVDPEASGARGGDGGTKLFLTFELERVGRFELELFAKGREITAGLFCPPSMKGMYDALRSAIGRAVAQAGFQLGHAQVRTLERARTLSEVFPKLRERGAGIDVII